MAIRDSNPRFTVIIPTKDRARYTYHTLRTCAEQDYENLDVVVSDDGSKDDQADEPAQHRMLLQVLLAEPTENYHAAGRKGKRCVRNSTP